jgi:hypothetical protein
MMDPQIAFNVAVGVAGTLGGWWLNVVWGSLKDLQTADRALIEKVGAIEVLVAGRYMTREEFTSTITALFAKLDKIQDLLNGKADK